MINQAGCVEDIIRDGKVDHSGVFLRKAHDRSKESNWGAMFKVKNFSLERENKVHLNFQSLPQGWTSELGSHYTG